MKASIFGFLNQIYNKFSSNFYRIFQTSLKQFNSRKFIDNFLPKENVVGKFLFLMENFCSRLEMRGKSFFEIGEFPCNKLGREFYVFFYRKRALWCLLCEDFYGDLCGKIFVIKLLQ